MLYSHERWMERLFVSVPQKRMQKIMLQCFLAVKSKLDCRLGFFDLIGCDFMVDEDFKVNRLKRDRYRIVVDRSLRSHSHKLFACNCDQKKDLMLNV